MKEKTKFSTVLSPYDQGKGSLFEHAEQTLLELVNACEPSHRPELAMQVGELLGELSETLVTAELMDDEARDLGFHVNRGMAAGRAKSRGTPVNSEVAA